MLSVDFVVELLESAGCDIVMIVVDSVSKKAYFILTHTTVTVEEVIWLFLHYIWKLHGLPQYVISDCEPQFIVLFTRELYKLLGIQLAFSIAWYLQMDRQIERINQKLD